MVHPAPTPAGCLTRMQKGRPRRIAPCNFTAEVQSAQSLSVSKKSFIRAKKPVDSGLFSLDDNCSNS